jgi:spore maturation protein CgeB
MKILIVGAWTTTIYEEPLAKGFENLGHTVYKFKWSIYFRNKFFKHCIDKKLSKLESFYYKIQNKYLVGPIIRQINVDLFEKCKDVKPDIVFLYRATHIRAETIKKIKRFTSANLISFHNDDPFVLYNRQASRNYIKSLSFMDWNYVYRKKNISDVKKYNPRCSVLLPYPNTDFIFPIENQVKKYDVIFIGHYENSGRDELICDLIAEKSINFMLFGTGWQKSPMYDYIREQLGDIKPIYDGDYNSTLNETKIALCFFSSLNNDRYTRRTFEIPAAGTLILSQYSNESAALLIPNEEAAYFRSKDELIEEIIFYLSHDIDRERVAKNGYKKVIFGGHTYMDRALQVTTLVEKNS